VAIQQHAELFQGQPVVRTRCSSTRTWVSSLSGPSHRHRSRTPGFTRAAGVARCPGPLLQHLWQQLVRPVGSATAARCDVGRTCTSQSQPALGRHPGGGNSTLVYVGRGLAPRRTGASSCKRPISCLSCNTGCSVPYNSGTNNAAAVECKMDEITGATIGTAFTGGHAPFIQLGALGQPPCQAARSSILRNTHFSELQSCLDER
jgi:hypothetical protein